MGCCEECGFGYNLAEAPTAASSIVAGVAEFVTLLADRDGYADQQPADVARQLSDAAQLFSNVMNRLSSADWDRDVIYNYPKPTVRSLRWVAVHTVHEVSHHLLDVRRQLA
jgi:hypothetical protein